MTTHEATLGSGVSIDVDRLVESRLLIQANSGAGKSWAIRRLLEQTYHRVPQIVIDVEGEFHTLREKYDYVLAGQKGGDCPADTKSAAMLALRLLELNVSAIVDIYELGRDRQRFVRLFLDALVNAPRDLWHPMLVVVDEAHLFAPEAGQSESASALIDLMTRGRKRGFCGVLATQRIAKLHKDAAAECNNKLIGRSALDIDMKRAGAELGFTAKEDLQRLRTLPAGTFFAFGPAISNEVTEVKIGKVETTHPKAGERAAAPTPPRDKVKRILAQLADLPHEAEAEARTAAELREQVKQLRRELAAKPSAKVETKTIEVPVLKDAQLVRIEKLMIAGGKIAMQAIEFSQRFGDEAEKLRAAVMSTKTPPAVLSAATKYPVAGVHRAEGERTIAQRRDIAKSNGHTLDLPVGELATLRALIPYPDGLAKRQLTTLTGYKRSTRDAYILRLRNRGFVEEHGDRVLATGEGCSALPDAEPLPTGEALQAFWFAKLPPGEAEILRILVDVYPEPIRKDAIDESTGFKRSTRDAYLSRLAAKELVVEPSRGEVRAVATLFEVS
jgi:hypothetical protein